MSILGTIESVFGKAEKDAETVITDVKSIATGPLVSEFLTLATAIKGIAGDPEVLVALQAAGVSSANAPALVATVVGVITTLEVMIQKAQTVATELPTTTPTA